MMSDTAPNEKDGQTVGSRLRLAREKKGLSLEDAARVTRISKGYLDALEEGNYSRLPSDAYARGFLRAYAQFLGIEAQIVPGLYPGGVPSPSQSETLKLTAGECRDTTMSWGSKRWVFVLLAGGCVLCAAAVLFFRFHGRAIEKKKENSLVVPPVMTSASSSQQPKSEVPPEKVGLRFTPPEASDIPPVPLVSREKGIVLKMKALEDGYLVVTIDDMVSQQYDLRAGDVIEWKAERVFSLDLDNAGGVEAELNGKLLKPFGAKGASAHVMLKAGPESDETAP
ncbi:MAG: helix-turn-helix domain-containing protein [Geobacteraceae bacterium]|nr:helix-turn-helix domain-containing protein [Geobacteraceae bacterium]